MVDGKMVCREDCPSVTHRNTPDTEEHTPECKLRICRIERGHAPFRCHCMCDCKASTTPDTEWEKEFDIRFPELLENDRTATNTGAYNPTQVFTSRKNDVRAFIQNLLDQHTARIVERISKLDTNHFCECKRQCMHSHRLLDQAIDIVKDNK
jgi:hypothetical protein